MNFKELDIYGFKSFADKIEVKFNSGVTGIVGPNGCGKSNVADSIRWVLGEQSAKSLRGATMQDVIFNGTEKRKPQSYAEVSLVFDNSEHIFNIGYEEVTITRKLYRSGESEYLINKNACRLKDILELLRDSGLGREGYSVIGQGKIDEILSAKPEDRRAVFEEAAGVAKLKNRRIETERKLERTRENLVRINDILHELSIQLEPLKEQAETAKKYLELKEKLKNLEINTYISQYDNHEKQKQEINTKLSAISEEQSLREQEFNETVYNYNKTMQDIKNMDEGIEAKRDELLSLTVGLEKQAGETRLVQEKANNLKEQIEKQEEEIKVNTIKFEQNEQRLSELESEKNLKSTILEELENKILSTNEAYDFTIRSILNYEDRLALDSDKFTSALDQLGDVKAQIGSAETQIEALKTKQKDILNRKSDAENKIKELNTELQNIGSELSSLKKERTLYFDKINKAKQEQLKLIYKNDNLEDEIVELSNEYHSATSRLKLIEELQRQNDGYVGSVKKLLAESKTNSSIGGKMLGVVAKLMTVDKKYETAIEMALGGSVQNIVTKNEDDAKYIINFLKERSMGRATFLPLTSMKPRSIDYEYKNIIAKTKGVYGIADELIEFDKKYSNIYSSLLGGTVIVEDMDTAISLAKECRYSFKIVTLDGDILQPQGNISGGSKKEQAISLIGREREIFEITKRIEEINDNITKKRKELDEIKELNAKFTDLIEKTNEFIQEVDIKLSQSSERELQLKNSLIENKNIIKIFEEESLNVVQDIKNFEKELQKYNVRKNLLDEEKANANNKKTDDEYLKLKERRETLANEKTDLKILEASTKGNLETINSEVSRLLEENEKLNKALREQKLENQQNLTELSKINDKLTEMATKSSYEVNVQSLQSIRDELANLDAKKQELSASITTFDDKKLVLSSELQRLADKKTKAEAELIKIDQDIEIAEERVWEEYGLTYGTALQYKQEDFDLHSGIIETGKLKKQINALGFVNVNAIESLKEVSARNDDLTIQRDDLVKAETDTVKIIKDLITEMEAKFKSEFDIINTNFQQVFKELFGGGRAELRLLDPQNVLDCGIEIVAEPTGKKLQSISLLSGGERAMTAIAILFAILKLKPMPFCVLDEIEAALDDANAERFAKYLKRFSNYTQFIVITHRKPTMELADSLYGVTMEERGVSKMVSVKLSDAIKTADESKK